MKPESYLKLMRDFNRCQNQEVVEIVEHMYAMSLECADVGDLALSGQYMAEAVEFMQLTVKTSQGAI